jgi:hypothetical protein
MGSSFAATFTRSSALSICFSCAPGTRALCRWLVRPRTLLRLLCLSVSSGVCFWRAITADCISLNTADRLDGRTSLHDFAKTVVA